MRDGKTDVPALIALGALSFIWGYNWVVVKVALGYAGPFMFAALRTLLGGAALLAVIPFLRRPLYPGRFLPVLVLGLLQSTIFTGLSTWALVSAGAGKTAVLVYSMPIWLILLSWPLLGERQRGAQWWAVPPVMAGLVLVVNPWRYHAQLSGTVLAVVGGLFWALSGVWSRVLRRYRLDRLTLTAWQLLLGGIPLLGIALLFDPRPVRWSTPFTLALLYNVTAATALAWTLWLFAVQRLPAGTAGMGTLLTPIIGVLSAWLQLGEAPSLAEGAGMLLVLSGLGILTWVSPLPPATPPEDA